jgi:acetoin utilization protein AcuB
MQDMPTKHASSEPLGLPIRTFMTASPHTIGRSQPIARAHERMREHGVRHLPVLEAGKLVGILSQRDALFVETLRDVDPEQVPVEDAMSEEVYTVGPETPLAEVVAAMAERKYGCVVVGEGAHVAGIFTTTDALRILNQIAKSGRA